MRMVKKVLALAFALVLLIGIAACGAQNTTASSATTTTSSAASTTTSGSTTAKSDELGLPIADGDIELTIYVGIRPGAAQVYTNYSEHPVVKEMEKETGLRLKFIHPTGDAAFFNTTIASGNWPDIWHTKFNTYPGGAEAAIEDGILLNINALVAEYSPNYRKFVEQYGVEREMLSDSGVIINYGVVMLPDVICDKVFLGFMIRQDLLDANNLEMPYTYNELESVLSVFQQNGYQTPMAIPMQDGSLSTHNNLSAGFGVTHSGWFISDGKVVYSPIQEGYRDYLTLLNDWYQKGYFSSDSLTYVRSDAQGALQADKVAIGYAHAAHSTTVKQVGKENNPDFDVVGMPVMRHDKDDTVSLVYRSLRVSNSEPWYISASSKHPVEAMRFLDYLFLEETQLLTAWGLSGDPDVPTFVESNGSREFTNFMTNNPDGFDFQTAKDRYILAPFQIMYDSDMEFQQYNYPEKLASIENFGYKTTADGLYPNFATQTADESRELDQIMNQINTYTGEMRDKFITGQVSLAQFDDFVAQVEALNIQRAAQLKQDAYERYLKR